jgi:hypothetical protein
MVAMNPFCKSCIETDLPSLHYISFIKPLVIFPTEAPSFDSEQFTNNSINKEIESKTNDPFRLFEEHFSAAVLVYKTPYKVQFQDLSSSSHKCKNSFKIFVHNKI